METIIYQQPSDPPPSPNSSTPAGKNFFSKHKNKLVFLFLLIIASSATSAYFLFRQPKLLTPLSTGVKILSLRITNPDKPDKIVYAFLPYWNLKYYNQIPYHLITHLAIFGVAYNPDGTIQTRELDYQEPGWRSLNIDSFNHTTRQARAAAAKVILVLRAFDNDTIESIINSPEHTQTLIDETISLIDEKRFDGINIDFEYVGTPNSTIRDNFTLFTHTLTEAVKEHNPDLHVSIDVYADSADQERLWDLEPIGQIVDHLIIMAYDFHRPSSPTAGPVAPLYGAGDTLSHDITSLLAKHLDHNPSDKLILGVPFYGYQWRTTTSKYLSQTYPGTGSLASYKRIQDLIKQEPEVKLHWDSVSLTPWLSFQEDGQYQQIYYDDVTSLNLKYDLVNQTDLAGIGIWAVGYEGTNYELWQNIATKF